MWSLKVQTKSQSKCMYHKLLVNQARGFIVSFFEWIIINPDWISLYCVLTWSAELFSCMIVQYLAINHSQGYTNLLQGLLSRKPLHYSMENLASMSLISKRDILCRPLTCFLKARREQPSRVPVVPITKSDLLHCSMLTSEAESGSFCKKSTSFSWILNCLSGNEWKFWIL